MRNFKFITAVCAAVALIFGLAASDLMACSKPFNVLNNTSQNITKITIHYCNGTTHDLVGIGPGVVHNNYVIPCGAICDITIEVNGTTSTTIGVPYSGPLPGFPTGVDATQDHIHFL